MIRNVGYTLYCANTEKGKRGNIEDYWPLFKDGMDNDDSDAAPSWAETPQDMRARIIELWTKNNTQCQAQT